MSRNPRATKKKVGYSTQQQSMDRLHVTGLRLVVLVISPPGVSIGLEEGTPPTPSHVTLRPLGGSTRQYNDGHGGTIKCS